MKKHIILIGFMCSGKTFIGKASAQGLNMPFIDIDEYITKKSGAGITHIFNAHGEDYFRRIERGVLKNILQTAAPSIIASGGGTPCFYNNIDLMNCCGITVYLQTDAKTLFNRIKQNGYANRPLLRSKTDNDLLNYIECLLAQREAYYKRAQYVVKNAAVDDIYSIAKINMA
jgi:shikimate kinase